MMHFPSEIHSRFLTELHVNTDIEYILDGSMFHDISSPMVPYQPALLIASETEMKRNILEQRNSCNHIDEDEIISFIESGELENIIDTMQDDETKRYFSSTNPTCHIQKEYSIFDEDIIWCQWNDTIANIVPDEDDLLVHDNNETANQKDIICCDCPSLHKSCERAKRRFVLNQTCATQQSTDCIYSESENESSVSSNVDIMNKSNVLNAIQSNDGDANLSSSWLYLFDEELSNSSTKEIFDNGRSESTCEQNPHSLFLGDYNECYNERQSVRKRKRSTTEDEEAMNDYKRPCLVDLSEVCFVTEYSFADANFDITRSL